MGGGYEGGGLKSVWVYVGVGYEVGRGWGKGKGIY